MNNLTVYVMTCDKYLPALRPFAYLFNRYWSIQQDVIVCGFTPPEFDLPSNFDFFSIGDMEDYPMDKWTDALIKTLLHFPKRDVFCLMLEDYWLADYVDVPAIGMLTDYMRQFRNVLKMDVRTDRRKSGGAVREFDNDACGAIKLVKSDFRSPYHFSLMGGLWNREAMLKVLRPGDSPHAAETYGKTYNALVSLRDDLLVLGTDQHQEWDKRSKHGEWCPLPHTLAHRRGDPSYLALDEDPAYPMQRDDIADLEEMGYIKRDEEGIYRVA